MFRLVLFVAFLTAGGICGSEVDTIDTDDGVLLFDDTQALEELGGTLACTVCEGVMKIVEDYLKKPENQENIKKWMEEACEYIPFFKTKCKELVKEYGVVVIDLAVAYLNPALCKSINLCTDQQVVSERMKCRMCKLAVGVVYDTASDPDLNVRIGQMLHEMCVDTFNTDKLCSVISEEVTASVLPVVLSLRNSEYFKNVCTEAEVCRKFI